MGAMGSAISVNSTVLVLARDSTVAYSATSGFNAHGIPYQLQIVPQQGISLPVLNSSQNYGNYGGIVVLGDVAYDYNGSWQSALTTSQYNQIYAYQSSFGVRMVQLDVFPGPAYGVKAQGSATGCCGVGEEQYISISDNSRFPTANIKAGAKLSTAGLYHYPAVITDPATTTEIARFDASSNGTFPDASTAAVINTFGNRQQMVWFTGWATEWSETSNFLQHAYIHWLTRGLFAGRRRVYLNTQVDDVHLTTALYQPNGGLFRARPDDLAAHVSWTADINSRMPAGSNYFIELGHNGNGNILNAVVVNNANNAGACTPDNGIVNGVQTATPLEFQKPIGSGTNKWPDTPSSYVWSTECSHEDPLASWFLDSSHLNAFAHVSHTFTHEDLDNATYADATRELSFNIAWLKQIGIWNANRFSPNGLIPPAITGMHNGDAIKAWSDNQVNTVVGDNTRPVLMSPINEYWPLITNVSSNGFDGMTVVPRWATTIFFNCDFANCTTQQWIDTNQGKGGFSDLLANALTVNTKHLLSLHQDPFMFHQANLRYIDTDVFTVGSQTRQMSLLMVWIETVVQEMARLTTWPILTLKHDDLGTLFRNRMALDQCQPTLQWNYNNDGTSIVGATVGTANGNTCSVPVPVTFPGSASTTSGGTTNEQIGSDPLTIWTTLNGSPVTFTLASPIPLLS